MFNSEHIVQSGGLAAVTLIIFAESGLLIGLILPGDSLLLAAGVFAGRGKLPIDWLVGLVVVAAILGYQVGYVFGERIGPRLFKHSDGVLFRKEYVAKIETFFKKYGAATVTLARFIAHVRTLVSIVAGASRMDKRRYFFYNVIGAVLWGAGLTLLGYWLGSSVPNVDHYIIPAILISLVIIYSFTFWQLLKNPSRRRNLRQGLKEDWNYFFKRKS